MRIITKMNKEEEIRTCDECGTIYAFNSEDIVSIRLGHEPGTKIQTRCPNCNNLDDQEMRQGFHIGCPEKGDHL